jgi:hypothetical protein
MGTYTFLADNPDQGIQKSRKHIFEMTMKLEVQRDQRPGWIDFMEDLPASYAAVEQSTTERTIRLDITYTARGANSHDIGRRLQQSGLAYLLVGSTRVKTCMCGDSRGSCTDKIGDTI